MSTITNATPYPSDIISLIHEAAKDDISVHFKGVARRIDGPTEWDIRVQIEAFRGGRFVKAERIVRDVGHLEEALANLIYTVKTRGGQFPHA